MHKKSVICFGECLWDLFPSGKIAGGAPMNVAIQLNNLGTNARFASKVGADDLGKELLDWQAKKGLYNDLMAMDDTYETGVVVVKLSEKGSPSYTIAAPVAWDFIGYSNELGAAVASSDLFVFGSLVSRNDNRSRTTLHKLLEQANTKVFDINLRAPHYDKRNLFNLLGTAQIVKMNDEELALIGAWINSSAKESDELMSAVQEHFYIDQLVVTFGAEGAKLLNNGKLFITKSIPVKVEDTVGCGDAFLAGFVHRFSQGATSQECLDFASGMGGYVATQKGGTPHLSEAMIEEFVEK